MGLHSEATLDRRFVEFARQMNAYLNHFPKHEKYGLALEIRRAAYELYGFIVEAQKRYFTYQKGSPRYWMPLYIFQCGTPSFLASCVAVSRSPWCSIQTCLRRLFCWVRWSAHRQFSGEYGPDGSMRSSVVPAGLSFAHSMKPANVRHASHTVTPFAPYAANCLSSSLWQRLTMWCQPLYLSRLAEYTQSFQRSAAMRFMASLRTQPHDDVLPDCSAYEAATFSAPHEHRQSHCARPLLPFSARRMAVSRPNVFPVKSTSFMPRTMCC